MPSNADALETEVQVEHYEARCMECFWEGRPRGTHKGAMQDAEDHGRYAGCWAAYPYIVYEDGTEKRA